MDQAPSIPITAGPQLRAPGYIPEVDALRGIAMTAVVAIHSGILPFGWMGVWAFYVISGFAVTTSWLAQGRGRSAARAVRDFYRRRALRIWPLYFAYLGLAVGWLAWTGHRGWIQDLPWLATFTFNMRMILVDWSGPEAWTGFGHLWTLAVEQQFYLVLPLVLLLPSRRMMVWALVVLAVAAPAIRHVAATAALGAGWGEGRAAFAAYALAPAHFDAFAAGALIALARHAGAIRPRAAHLAAAAAALIAVAHVGAFLALGIARHGVGTEALRNIVSGILVGDGREVTVYLLPVSAAAAALLAILAGRRWALAPCRVPGLQAMGRVSYGGYLFHLPVLMALQALLPFAAFGVPGRIGLFFVAMAVTLALAAASHRWFESRFLRRSGAQARDGKAPRPAQPLAA
ncbi:acyltransferase [Roseomonas sp. HF4]|uniref:acyltransferase family protein n=1 Tax=Roseomonas sp. HF4 TaxID=2562313 RepID=UPI0010BFA49F|nr:acyltransferase [Roseomonas sp. HF4]